MRAPSWWHWDLELNPHVLTRMEERDFTEVELRGMLSRTSRLARDVVPGRWQAFTRWRKKRWIVILEPDPEDRVVVVITAFQVEP